MTMSEDAILSVAVVASTLNISRQRVHQLIGAGTLRARQWDGLHWVVLGSDLEAYIGADRLERSLLVRGEWAELRRVILAKGGIGPSPDWPRDWYPADLYRKAGKAPDLVAAETMLGSSDVPPWGAGGDDAAMFSYLQASWAEDRKSVV